MKMYEFRHWHHSLVAIVVALLLNFHSSEARSLKSAREGSEQRHGQLESLNDEGIPDTAALGLDVPNAVSLKKGEASDVEVEDGGVADADDVLDESSEKNVEDEAKEEETEEKDAEKKAEEVVEKDEKKAEDELKKDEKKAEHKLKKVEKKETKAGGAHGGGKEAASLPAPAPAAHEEMPSTTPMLEPFSYMYQDSDSVARDVELRRGVEFHPQGTQPEIDMSKQEQFTTDTFFSQDPSIFGHCILIRDFAEPLRVGSALIKTHSSLLRGGQEHRHHHRRHHHAQAAAMNGWHANSSVAAAQKPPERFVRAFASSSVHHQSADDDHDHKNAKEENKLPHQVLLPKGGVMDRDTAQSVGADGTVQDDVELEVNMFVWLRSVAGEVAVIPNGDIAKWSSKKKVPIAGYLCTTDQGPVLHTLPTPCLPTSLDENGQAFAPPMPTGPTDAHSAFHGVKTNKAAPKSKAPAPAAGAEDQETGIEAEAEKEAAAVELVSNGPATQALLEVAKRIGTDDGPAPAPSAAPGPGPAPANPLPMPKGDYQPYHVWVGTTLLEFRSKPKAERFCKRLTKTIAEDIGDAEWDGDRVLSEQVNKKDMSVANFMAVSRKPSVGWTTGTKTLLVVVMDWMRGDSSKAPYTEQTQTPSHYKDKIFPRVRQAFQRMSYGQFDVSVTVVPEVVPFSKPRSRYTAGGYPFPGLYNGAKDSIEGSWKFGDQYNFNDYDLVYVISPQQAPTGTKGVAWVGAKGAMCNGCEAISDNFQVMVAVHELGHNLGLWHASSKSLEYGNVFDWMGNYPDVTGLSYGLGYKLRLHWLPQTSIAKIDDSDLGSLNDEFYLMPFDSSAAPIAGQLTGIQIDLQDNRRFLYVSYRKEPGTDRAGIFLTMQDRDKPNSELVDCACHSPSQQDAALRQGWTYIDPSGSVVIHAQKVEDQMATVHIYKAPSSANVASIKARSGFTDGTWKCPRVCTDADLLVSAYKGCGMLAVDGYCKGGSITMSGKKFSIANDLCPKSCDQCAAATSGEAETGNVCKDKQVKISGMSCPTAAAKGYCDYSTNIGHIGDDLCPGSCNRCPTNTVAPAGRKSDGRFADPAPVRQHGIKGAAETSAPAAKPETEQERNTARADKEKKEEAAADEKDTEDEKEAEGGVDNVRDTCTDDPVWTDADGDDCKVYASYVKQGKLTQDEACNYGTGASKMYCRATCQSCEAKTDTCEDKQCVTRWRYERGKCFACSEWQNHCNKDFFAHDCPRTCGMCQAVSPDTTPPLPTTPVPPTTTVSVTMPPTLAPTAPPPCEDDQCVASWKKSFGVCHKCSDFAEDYCGRDELFMQSCPKSCRICFDGQPACHDDFLPHTCKRYTDWGWCSTPHIANHCKASCGQCAAALVAPEEPKLQGMPLLPGAAVRTSPFFMVLFLALLGLLVGQQAS